MRTRDIRVILFDHAQNMATPSRNRFTGIQVLFEDNHLIAVNKPAGLLVQGDETGDPTLSDWVKAYIKDRYQKPGDVFLGVIHRLDRPVSGVVIFARTSKALVRMNELFAQRKVEKKYLAIVSARPDPLQGRLVHFILKDPDKNIVKTFDHKSNRSGDAKEAILDYELLGSIGDHHLLEVHPLTGRPHQIRAQLARMGSPIYGDVKYGGAKMQHDTSILLHCNRLSFEHPVKKTPVLIEADAPKGQRWDLFGL